MKAKKTADPAFYGTATVPAILLRVAPPVMLAYLIQALYNLVDSFFVGRYSEQGLTALSVIFPLQLIITALAVGTGTGVNTLMARYYAIGQTKKADATAGTGLVLSLLLWAAFALFSAFFMRPFAAAMANDPEAVRGACIYGLIVCVGSIGQFTEGIFTKVHQAQGNMILPMYAQIAGAVCNLILDPILIFGIGPVPSMGIAGAAVATVLGQILAAVITGVRGFRKPPELLRLKKQALSIFHYGYPSILMQSLYTVYIVILNLILAGFCDEAVTVLGLYYKLQTFLFIPLHGLETCIVPIISYNYVRGGLDRVRQTLRYALGITAVFMFAGTLSFELIPVPLLGIFSGSELVFSIGRIAFRIIGLSFVPATFSLMLPVFFQALGKAGPSVLLTLSRQIFCLIPLFYGFSRLGLSWSWLAFPLSEIITGAIGLFLYFRQVGGWKKTS